MENRRLELTATNDKGLTLKLTLELTTGDNSGLLVSYRVTDASGATVTTMEATDDPFGFLGMINERVGFIMEAANEVADSVKDLSRGAN